LGDGTVLVAGGLGADGWLRNAELYDPARGRWTRVAPMTTAREGATATLLGNGRVLVAGGGNPSALNSAELYDPVSGKWTATGSMTGYGGTAALLQDGRVLVAGYENEGEVYSPATGTWTATGPLPYPGVSGSAAALLPSGQVLYVGGERNYCGVKNCFSDPSASAELYTP
jgi:N-acetylneuraminic acid mutarotase